MKRKGGAESAALPSLGNITGKFLVFISIVIFATFICLSVILKAEFILLLLITIT